MLCFFRKILTPTRQFSSRTLPVPPRFNLKLVQSMSSESTKRIFHMRLDPLTGNLEWVVIEDGEVPEEFPKPLLATTSYLDMLNDSSRNRAFCAAIDKTITRPCHVLDIGAGTGLLSMMAARAMGLGYSIEDANSDGMVTACESYLPMVKLMRKVLRANGMEKKIRVINKRSDELEVGVDIKSRADVLVSEILDSELLGEGLIPTLQHAHDKLLVENPQTIPYRATIYGQLVESSYLWKMHDLFSSEAKALDKIHLVPEGMNAILSTKHQQYAMHCDAITKEIKPLSEPFKVFDFDFWRRPDSFRQTNLVVKTTNSGTAHAIISWWLLQLDSEGTVFYSTEPRWLSCTSTSEVIRSSFACSAGWCDHWKQCVWFIQKGDLSVCKDEEVNLCATHTDTSILYEVLPSNPKTEVGFHELSNQEFQVLLLPERIALYGDDSWRCSMLKAIMDALQQKISPLCVVADDSIFLTIAIAHLSKTSHVISLLPGLRQKGAAYLQAVANANDCLAGHIEVPKERKRQLTMQDTHQKRIDLLIGEPFYYGTEGMLPWQNLRFWKERTMFDPVLSEDVLIMPCRGLLRACAMSLPDLWKSRRCLNDVEGFDHSAANIALGACGDLPAEQDSPILPFSLWQCGGIKQLSEIVTIMEFNFLQHISPCVGRAKVEFTESGICHGFVLWIDWVLNMEASIVLSTGPDHRSWCQGVKLLEKPVAVGRHASTLMDCPSAEITASFDPTSGDLIVKPILSLN